MMSTMTTTPPYNPKPDGADKPPARPGDAAPPKPNSTPRPFERGDEAPGKPVRRNG